MKIDVVTTPEGNRFRWCRSGHYGIEHEITSNVLIAPSKSQQEGLVVRNADGEIVDRGFVHNGYFHGKDSPLFSGGSVDVAASRCKVGWTVEIIPRTAKGYDIHELFDLHFGAALFGLEVFGTAPFYKKLQKESGA